MFEFQTAMSELTGLPVSNAALYEGPSSVASAAYLAIGGTGRRKLVASRGVHPHSRESLVAYGAGYDSELTEDFCLIANQQFDCTIPGSDGADNALLAPAGTRLPITSKFKGNAVARYEFPVATMKAHFQAGLVYEGDRTTDLRLLERDITGKLPSYTTVDLSAGVRSGTWSAELFVRNLFDKVGETGRGIQCLETVCGDPGGVTAIGPKIYTYITQPRTIGLKVGTKF
jgi:outer membrane receptor protein involved in Fe transport